MQQRNMLILEKEKTPKWKNESGLTLAMASTKAPFLSRQRTTSI